MATATGALITPIGVLSFPNLFKPRPPHPSNPQADPRFTLNLVFDEEAQKSPQYKSLQTAVAECAKEAFGENVKFNKIRLPFRDSGEKDEYAGYEEGMMHIAAWSKSKPGIIDARKQEVLVPDDVWPGQLARASVKPFAYDVNGNKGVSFALNNVQICKMDMPRLDGRKAATEEFDEVEMDDEDDNSDPFA